MRNRYRVYYWTSRITSERELSLVQSIRLPKNSFFSLSGTRKTRPPHYVYMNRRPDLAVSLFSHVAEKPWIWYTYSILPYFVTWITSRFSELSWIILLSRMQSIVRKRRLVTRTSTLSVVKCHNIHRHQCIRVLLASTPNVQVLLYMYHD